MEEHIYTEKKISGGYGALFANFILLIIMVLFGAYGALHILEKGKEVNEVDGILGGSEDFYTSDDILEEDIKVLVEINTDNISEAKLEELIRKIVEIEDIDNRKIEMLSKEIGI